ncbi:MAG TPA: hypothetical protein VMC84_06600 [Methanocella sp.]|uniref:hypothetical protein n=1 Tax=Methanocella sp. TaxID=2052833 RepID=UPI002BB0320F|nr:hypothetical protein [Methanocella sp.]HTY90830.1 hypothetical protein [Methanocella sp.]
MGKVFERLFNLFRKKRADAPVDKDFLKPRAEPVKKPVVVTSDMKAPPAAIQEMPPAIMLPETTLPMEELKPMVQLPPDIDPSQVVIVRHDARKADGERFKYSDKPLKPLRDDVRGSELIKYNDGKGGETVKYNAKPAAPRPENEGKKNEVFKYTPTRVVIKN